MAKIKITNETAKKKFKELYKKYNGNVDKIKAELINKYDFDYKTVAREVINEVKAEKTSKPSQPYKGYTPPKTPSPSQPYKGYTPPKIPTPDLPNKNFNPNETKKINPEFIKQFPPKKNADVKDNKSNNQQKQEAKPEEPHSHKQENNQTPKQEVKQENNQTPKQEVKQENTSTPKQETSAVAKATTEEAKEVEKSNKIKALLNYAKRNPKMATAIFGILALMGYSVKKATDNKQPQQQPTPTPSPQQTSAQASASQTQPQQTQSQQTPAVASAQDFTSAYSEELKQAQGQMLSLFQDLDKHRQLYEETVQKYSQANEIYEKQLLQLLPTIPLLLAKTPLNNMTSEDLIQHTNQLFTTMPYEDAIGRVGSLTKGYYIAKMNGVDPKSLSTTDLLEIAENPVLAKSSDENLAQFLGQIGEVLKYKIKSNLDKIGAVKDAYELRLKELQEKGKMYNDTIRAIKDEYNFMLNEQRVNLLADSINARFDYLQKALEEKREEAIMKQQKPSKGKSMTGGFQFNDEYLNNLKNQFNSAMALAQQNCPKDSSGNIDTNCASKYMTQLTPNQ
jgi:hypothetical protein